MANKGKSSKGWEQCWKVPWSHTETVSSPFTIWAHPWAHHLIVSSSSLWTIQSEGWYCSRLTPTIRQMELKGARQRPGIPCQLIWPQAQCYSVATNAVKIQLRLGCALFAVSFSRLLKRTAVLKLLIPSRPNGYICQSQICVVDRVSLGTRESKRARPHLFLIVSILISRTFLIGALHWCSSFHCWSRGGLPSYPRGCRVDWEQDLMPLPGIRRD